MRSFRRRATCNATPSMRAAPGWSSAVTVERGSPMWHRWRVACPQTVGNVRRQLPTVSHRMLVGPVGPSLEPSRWWKPGRLPRGTHWPLHSPQQIPVWPTTLTAHTLHDDGQGRCAWTEGGASATVCTRRHGKVEHQPGLPWMWGMRQCSGTVTEAKPHLLPPESPPTSWRRVVVAIQTGVVWAQTISIQFWRVKASELFTQVASPVRSWSGAS